MVERTASNWIQTYTRRQFFPLDPKPQDVCIEDIAHGLSNVCRFNGHTRRFYSVAQHSILVSRLVGREDGLWGLLHDASEAYIADITRPVKPYLTNYAQIEEGIMAAIAEKFGLPLPMPPNIKRADIIVLNTEKRDLMAEAPAPWARDWDAEPLREIVFPMSPEIAKHSFLFEFRQLTQGRYTQ